MSPVLTEDEFLNCPVVVSPNRVRWPRAAVLFVRYPSLTRGDGPKWVRAYEEGRKALGASGLKKRYKREHLN